MSAFCLSFLTFCLAFTDNQKRGFKPSWQQLTIERSIGNSKVQVASVKEEWKYRDCTCRNHLRRPTCLDLSRKCHTCHLLLGETREPGAQNHQRHHHLTHQQPLVGQKPKILRAQFFPISSPCQLLLIHCTWDSSPPSAAQFHPCPAPCPH